MIPEHELRAFLQSLIEQAQPPYEIGPYRPPSQANSYLVRVSRNCRWNRCDFCPLYKEAVYEERPVEDVLADIDRAAEFHSRHGPQFREAFLQDADPLRRETEDLVQILERIRHRFPSIGVVTSYATSASLYRKSLGDLRRLREAGITQLHRGLESGYDPLLRWHDKGANSRIQIEGGRKARKAGITLSDYVMPGLAGNLMLEEGLPCWMRHAEETARVLNESGSDYIRLRTLVVPPGSRLEEKARSGEFTRLPDAEIMKEIRLFIEYLRGTVKARQGSKAIICLMF